MGYPINITGLPLTALVADSFVVDCDEIVTPGLFYVVRDATLDPILKTYESQVFEFTGTQLNYYYLSDGQSLAVDGLVYSYSPINGWIPANSYNSGSPDAGGGAGGITEAQVQSAVVNAITASEPVAVDHGGMAGTAVNDVSGSATAVASTIAANTGALETEIHNKSTTDFLYVRAVGVATTTNSFTIIPLASRILTGVKATQSYSVITDGASVPYFVEYVV